MLPLNVQNLEIMLCQPSLHLWCFQTRAALSKLSAQNGWLWRQLWQHSMCPEASTPAVTWCACMHVCLCVCVRTCLCMCVLSRVHGCGGHGWQQDHRAITSVSRSMSSETRATMLPSGAVASPRREAEAEEVCNPSASMSVKGQGSYGVGSTGRLDREQHGTECGNLCESARQVKWAGVSWLERSPCGPLGRSSLGCRPLVSPFGWQLLSSISRLGPEFRHGQRAGPVVPGAQGCYLWLEWWPALPQKSLLCRECLICSCPGPAPRILHMGRS